MLRPVIPRKKILFPPRHAVDFPTPRSSSICRTFESAVLRMGSPMNAIFLSSPNKSLRQFAPSRYTLHVEKFVQAPQRRLFHFQRTLPTFTRAANLSIFNSLHTLKFDLSASHSFSTTCALFVKHRGYTPKLPILEPPCSRVRFPERGPLRSILAPIHASSKRANLNRSNRTIARSSNTPNAAAEFGPSGRQQLSLAIKKQSIPNLPSIRGNERKANDVYKVFRHSTDLQEIDR